jgi:hypothetical protein
MECPRVLPRRAQLPHELRDGGIDLVGAVLVDEMDSADGQVGPRADEVADAAVDDGARFGHIGLGQTICRSRQPPRRPRPVRRRSGGCAATTAWGGGRGAAGRSAAHRGAIAAVHVASTDRGNGVVPRRRRFPPRRSRTYRLATVRPAEMSHMTRMCHLIGNMCHLIGNMTRNFGPYTRLPASKRSVTAVTRILGCNV